MQSDDYERKLELIKEEMREFGCSELAVQKLVWKILEIQSHPGGFIQGLIEDSPRLAEQLSKGKFKRH